LGILARLVILSRTCRCRGGRLTVRMAAHEEAVRGVVAAQQAYAGAHDLAGIFEALTLLIIFSKPANPIEFIAAEAAKLKGTKQFEPPLVRMAARSPFCV